MDRVKAPRCQFSIDCANSADSWVKNARWFSIESVTSLSSGRSKSVRWFSIDLVSWTRVTCFLQNPLSTTSLTYWFVRSFPHLQLAANSTLYRTHPGTSPVWICVDGLRKTPANTPTMPSGASSTPTRRPAQNGSMPITRLTWKTVRVACLTASLLATRKDPITWSSVASRRELFLVSASLRSLQRHSQNHTPSIAFRHPPPNSTRFSYATEGALFISAQLSSDAVSALPKVRVLIWLKKQPSAKART